MIRLAGRSRGKLDASLILLSFLRVVVLKRLKVSFAVGLVIILPIQCFYERVE